MHLIYKENNKVNWITPIPLNHTYTDYVEVEMLPTYDYDAQDLDIVEENGIKKVVVVSKQQSELLKIAKEKKKAEIIEYDNSANVNSFLLNGHSVWVDSNTRTAILRRLNAETGENTSAFASYGISTVKRTIAIDTINSIEFYSSKCWDVTNLTHIPAVSKLTTVTKVNDYDITKGYPTKLNLTL